MSEENWFLPGGPVIAGDGRRLHLIPPRDWKRIVLELPRVPPSMNTDKIRGWRSFAELKKSWQEELETLIMIERTKGIARGRYERAMVGGYLRFAVRRRVRDPSNFARLVDKATGDALVSSRLIPDDDEPHYHFSGLEIEGRVGPDRTRLCIYLQPSVGAVP